MLRKLHELFANLTLILAILHVSRVALASIAHRENLAAAMIARHKRAGDDQPMTRRGPVSGP